ncbi:MAG: hypothetical protein AAB839_00615 [Patescibacteria group bacterium]
MSTTFPDGGPQAPSPMEREKDEFARRVEAAEDAVAIAQLVRKLLPRNKIEEQQDEPHPGEYMPRSRAEQIKDLISIGNKAGIRRFTRRVYFTALAAELGGEDQATGYMMSPDEAEAEGRLD